LYEIGEIIVIFPIFNYLFNTQVVEQHSLVTCLNDMVPVRARRQIIYPLEQLGINAPSDRVLKNQQPYALNHVNRKLVLEPKVRRMDIFVKKLYIKVLWIHIEV
jgi:hypothetical protein